MTQRGTMVIVEPYFLSCRKDLFTWRAQPMIFNGRYPGGNVLLSFSVVMAGTSISKNLLVSNHMGCQFLPPEHSVQSPTSWKTVLISNYTNL